MEIISLNSLSSTEIKKKLLNKIREVIEKFKTQTEAATILGIDQPKVSQIKNGKIDGFSLERLLVFLKKLGCKITITVVEGQTLESEAGKVKYEVEH